MRKLITILLFVCTSFAPGFQLTKVERFDTSGMPSRPTNFLEQQIFEMIGSHKFGDVSDAIRIQQKLGRYYADKGDERRSTSAFLLAGEAENKPEKSTPEPGKNAAVPVAIQPPAAERTPAFSGRYYGYEGRTLHTWDFLDSGSFLHTWVASGAGTSVRNSERGTFRLTGSTLELSITSNATGFTTPGVGGRSTLTGGGGQEASEIRRLKIAVAKDEVVLDGVTLKPRSW